MAQAPTYPAVNSATSLNALKALLKLQDPSNMTDSLANGGAERESADRVNAAPNAYDTSRMAEDRARADEIENEQRQEVGQIHGAQLGAQMSGFDSPQAQAQYNRKQEERKIEIPVEAAKASGAAGMDRLIASQQGQDQRTQAVIQGEQQRQQQALAARHSSVPIPFQQMKAMTDAKTAYEGPLNSLLRKVGANGGRREYENNLTSVLERKGDLGDLTKIASGLQQYPGTLDDKINAAQGDNNFPYDLSSLDDLHRAYLQLKLGQ